MKVDLVCNPNQDIEIHDTYSLDFGIRSITWSGTENSQHAWKINSEPFYCMGVNRHEDFAVFKILDKIKLVFCIFIFKDSWQRLRLIYTD